MKNKVLIRKPSDDEQRQGKIVTSDYAVSAITIHSSVLKTLGWIDKIYRSKKATVSYSNKYQIKKLKKAISDIKVAIKKYTPNQLNKLSKMFDDFDNFVNYVKSNSLKKWDKEKTPKIFLKYFKTPTQMLKVEKHSRTFDKLFENELIEALSYDYRDSVEHTVEQIIPEIINYLDKIETQSVKKNTQIVIYEKELATQKRLEKELGKNFSVIDYAKTLDNYALENIQNEWHIDLLTYKGSWEDLTKYLYSPKMIFEIRDKLGVQVRSRSIYTTRKGVESLERKKLKKILENKKRILGNDFDKNSSELEIEKTTKEVELAKNRWDEARVTYSLSNKSEELKQAVQTLRQKYYYIKRKLTELKSIHKRKLSALEVVQKYERKNDLINELINETRSGEEISILEQDEITKSVREVKNEKEIPYYTWRFVCDKIDQKTATMIEDALEENLNKGSGINGEDGYINVTAFPMTKSYEFFVDYPKNSNLFRAFKNKGIELSKILVDGVARHLGKSFVNCQGETYFNNPMGKTLNGDMLEWIGV